ncbi:TetR/AcrR family transcriptional regulator [Jiangella asiatica]|uniref:TetR/AcrR family transcriptional regulator n=1 Tax=Jiangella asiatica TaxID=2530372 RepID=A0A4R5D5W8_9ACTN|nr:TetR/AcrR family transcriptional regulator [Jiangella asiatica]TDE07947.1 TetR/AcrR family transcriptional regulator [Jiangella asiatica]
MTADPGNPAKTADGIFDSQPVGLRERKKLKAMNHIQRVAIALFDEHGYGNVTIERIAAEAEVSPSSVYRYFGTKEQIVLWDVYDPIAIKAFDDQLAARDPVTALRAVIHDMIDMMTRNDEEELAQRRMHYAMTEPAVRAGMDRQAAETEVTIRELLAKHTGRDPNDLELRATTAAIVAAFIAAVAYWHDTGYRDSLRDVIDGALVVVNRGLRLD